MQGSVLTITFESSPEGREAQAGLAAIEGPVTFVYGPEGRAPGAEKLRGEVSIRPSGSEHIIIASGGRKLERGYFGL